MAENLDAPSAPIGMVTLDGDRYIREMSAALAKYERDMAFTAPELYGMRMHQLRLTLASLLEQEDEDDLGDEVEAFVNDGTRSVRQFLVPLGLHDDPEDDK